MKIRMNKNGDITRLRKKHFNYKLCTLHGIGYLELGIRQWYWEFSIGF